MAIRALSPTTVGVKICEATASVSFAASASACIQSVGKGEDVIYAVRMTQDLIFARVDTHVAVRLVAGTPGHISGAPTRHLPRAEALAPQRELVKTS